MKKKKEQSKYHVPNLERALKIFELLSKHPEGLSIADISNRLEFPRNSVFRILSTLFDKGYLSKDEELKTYYLSQKLLRIGIKAYSAPSLVEMSLPMMHELVEKYGETVPLGVIKDGKGIVLEAIAGTHQFRYVLEPGKLFNVHTSAAGKSIMAYLPEAELTKHLEEINFVRFNERTLTTKKDYLKELNKVRTKGYAVDNAEEVEGMHCIGAPIFNRTGYPVAAVWISGPSIRISEKQYDIIGKDIKNYADQISKVLGYSGKKVV